ncbi:MAG: hypothetical protein KGJ06_07260 [Pseudomonadota bacterium]|nr:hypothetical protein [Pseudomonadota bacterium]
MMHIRIRPRTIKDLENLYSVAQTLAQHFPMSEAAVTGIYELLLNAVEHGNLGIGFATKTALVRQGIWLEEINRRLALPENADKEVEISLLRDDRQCRLTIGDQGGGFAWHKYIGKLTDSSIPNGRGLWIALHSNFARIAFNASGNKVTCVAEYCRLGDTESQMAGAA